MKYLMYIPVLIILGTLASCEKNYNLTAKIDGPTDEPVIVRYSPLSKYKTEKDFVIDTIMSRKGSFVYNSPVDEPILAIFTPLRGVVFGGYIPPQQSIELVIKPDDKINVEGAFHRYYTEYTANGSEFNEQHSKIRSEYIVDYSRAFEIECLLDSMSGGSEQIMDSLFTIYLDIIPIVAQKQMQYVKANWDTDLAAYYLSKQDLATFGVFYSQLTKNVVDGAFSELLKYTNEKYHSSESRKAAFNTIKEGVMAPDFSLNDINGKKVTLNEIKSDYVILDFWGTWCSKCIEGFPKMKEYQKKYQDKITVITISCRDKHERWKKVVNKLDLGVFTNLLNTVNVDVEYGIQSYPTKFVLDKNKKIILRFIGEGKAFYKKIDELMNAQ